MEWTARLIDKNIAYRVTPSFTHGTSRDGLGLEASGTFPDLQVHLEGTEWFFNGGAERLEGLVGLSGVFQGTEWTLECLQDGTGEALGTLSTGNLPATYLFASAQRPFTGEWQAQASLVKAVEGGPFLLWPKVSWEFEPRWKLLFQAQWPLGKGPGPLALEPGRTGVSMDYSF
jgi:hypothetical protein